MNENTPDMPTFKEQKSTPPVTNVPPKTSDDSFGAMLKTFVYAIVIALVFRSLFFEPFHIPSASMRPTLLEGDYIFVSKYSYGYSRYSFPLGLNLFEGRIWQTQPERGDVIVFRKPHNESIDYIKRLVGLPGDKIQVKDGVLNINGAPLLRKRVEDYAEPTPEGVVNEVPHYIEYMSETKQYHTLDETLFGQVDFTGIYEVPEKTYFFMGDNRDNSRDSRYIREVGFVPEENLVGRAEMIAFSIGGDARFWEFWKWPSAFRSGRFFKHIE